jgi:hypothetical protein
LRTNATTQEPSRSIGIEVVDVTFLEVTISFKNSKEKGSNVGERARVSL